MSTKRKNFPQVFSQNILYPCKNTTVTKNFVLRKEKRREKAKFKTPQCAEGAYSILQSNFGFAFGGSSSFISLLFSFVGEGKRKAEENRESEYLRFFLEASLEPTALLSPRRRSRRRGGDRAVVVSPSRVTITRRTSKGVHRGTYAS